MPITMATVVVPTKNATVSSPRRLSCSVLSLAAKPRMMEAKTRGTTIICKSVRNTWPGKASQLPIVALVAGLTQPAEGPSATPTPTPAHMPSTTCNQSRRRTKSWSLSLRNLSERGCMMARAWGMLVMPPVCHAADAPARNTLGESASTQRAPRLSRSA